NLILPIASDITKFQQQIPEELKNVNGFELASSNDIENLVSCILEGLSLLRLSRRLFISYKRDESSTVAIQLFEQLEKSGFDVFLDTHSIRPGEPFQDELWHRMADTDVVVLLNTPGFLNSNWTTQELAKANSMSIGILQVIWPSHKLERDAELSIPFQLTDSDFGNKIFKKPSSYLSQDTISKIISQVESLRARSLASRQDNILTEFIASSTNVGKKVDLQSEKFISIKQSDGREAVIIPTVGVPQAFTYNQSEELVARIKLKNVAGAYLLYDHRNIREKWMKHLDWLDNYLPVKTIKIVKAEEWLKTI
ncbi:MAG: toll/interleukin-1 receptor domain-containing protein, partial [Bacteroidia bacterium]